MFEILLVAGVLIVIFGVAVAFDGSRDIFHPLILIGPMLLFLYAWMPYKLLAARGLEAFFDNDQLVFVQALNVCGIAAFVLGCLSAGVRVGHISGDGSSDLTHAASHRILAGSIVAGGIGLTCWLIAIINVGGFVRAFSTSYSGGWDDSGYIRDGSLLLLVGILLAVVSLASKGPRVVGATLLVLFGLPWASSAVFMARRGPTFAMIVVPVMGWYLTKRTRPPFIATVVGGLVLGSLLLWLVANRGSIHLGASAGDMKADMSSYIDKPDPGNEYIYGVGTVLNARRRNHYFWMKRYLAQILVRPVPSAIWPTKYEDFGVAELRNNAGTGGFGEALGWEGAPGAAPGAIADLWVEVWWFAVPCMGLLGWTYGVVWKQAVTRGGVWASQYVVISVLSLYFVMQTMEAVIFRVLILSIPCWLSWKWALKRSSRGPRRNWDRPRRYLKLSALQDVNHG